MAAQLQRPMMVSGGGACSVLFPGEQARRDGKPQVFRPSPAPNRTSHAADAFRYLAMTLDGATKRPKGFDGPIVYPESWNRVV